MPSGLLREVLEESRRLVQLPDNDFMYSSWIDAGQAAQEIDRALERLRLGELRIGDVSILFAPTGPMQELAISSGWGDAFLALADKFDEAAKAYECSCLTSLHRDLPLARDLGMDARFGEIAVLNCPICHRDWMRYFYEDEAFSESARWFECVLTKEESATLTADQAITILRSKPWHFCGGSYFGCEVTRRTAPPLI